MAAANDSKKTIVLQSSSGKEFEIKEAVAMESQTIGLFHQGKVLLRLKQLWHKSIEREELAKMESISKQMKGIEILEELFFVLQEMQKNLVYQSKEQKAEALKLLDLENIHSLLDELI
ncbi:uncharacterized protein A4U43_C09F2640 [Asparagus officinalis]|uniref:SKP1 component POZ domain-containing protein n=1 Tax=Asparagus officinalis TaxID=4686 RepID=A0A5P1E827_ASPOF|nr:uncharacterized protein A4U43_C09F2640 [Asparagus officinalis]